MTTTLEAGREMNAEVAEKVMGKRPGVDFGEWPDHEWKRDANGNVEDFDMGDYHDGPVCARCGYGYCRNCAENGHAIERHCSVEPPRYSESIAAAWLVVNTLVEKGYKVSVHNRAVGPWACWIGKMIDRSEMAVAFEYAETPALAICRAALQLFPEP